VTRLTAAEQLEMIENVCKRFDVVPLFTHVFRLDQITEAYELFGERREDMIKVVIKP
jgi:threonine dehydrogenase-like Zn-dependent dehydrogenase